MEINGVIVVFSEETVGKFLENQLDKIGNRDYIVYPEKNFRVTFKEFHEKTDKLAKGLLSIGIKKGDHVGLWAKNIPEWGFYMMALAKIGAVLVTLNTAYTAKELDYTIKQSDMKALILEKGFKDNNYVKMMYSLIPDLKKSVKNDLKLEKYPLLKNIIFMGEYHHRGMYNTYELITEGKSISDKKLKEVKDSVLNSDIMNIQYTSGTTGFPKGVMLTHRNCINNAYNIGFYSGLTNNDRLFNPLPLSHSYGLSLILGCLCFGRAIVMTDVFNPSLILSSIQNEKCEVICGVPTIFLALINHPMFEMYDVSSLKHLVKGGSYCPPETLNEIITKLDIETVISGYGLTEASSTVTSTDFGDGFDRILNTIGKALFDVEVKIVDRKTGEKLESGEIGEICCSGVIVMKGYYKMPDKTHEAIDEDGWLHTGDLGKMDKCGYVSIVGRIKDMINRGGENIYPTEIENLLISYPGVEAIEVVGVPDKYYGEIVVAFVIKSPDADLEEGDVRDYVDDNLAHYKVPKCVFFIDEFPLNVSGKVLKNKLSDLAQDLIAKKKKDRIF
jgi:fatty-acyl-CoA synthase